MPPRRRRGSSNLWLALFMVVVLVPLLALGGVYFFVDPNGFKPRIIEAVRRATGRELTLHGNVSLSFAFEPVLRVADVSLANPPGASRADMVTLKSMEARLALWPLLRGRAEVRRLLLIEPDVLLEQDAAGVGNWSVTPPQREMAATAPAGAVARLTVAELRVEGGRVAWRSGSTVQRAAIHWLSGQAANAEAPISAAAEMVVDGQEVSLSAELGSAQRFMDTTPDAVPWPAQLVARLGGARIALSGTVASPSRGLGYRLGLEASVPDLAPIGTALGLRLPSLRDVTASARLDDTSGRASLSALSLHGGPVDLASVWPGLTAEKLELYATGLDQPVSATVEGLLGPIPARLAGTLGAMRALLQPGPYPIDLMAAVAGARLAVQGSVAQPLLAGQPGQGFDGTMNLRVADLAVLHAALLPKGAPWPALRDLSVTAHLTDQGSGWAARDLTIQAPSFDLAGALAVVWSPTVALAGQLAGQRVDLDSVQALLATLPPTSHPGDSGPGGSARPSPSAAPLQRLARQDVDLRVTMGEVRSGGAVYHDAAAHLLLTAGRLVVDQVSATLPGGRMEGRVSIGLDDDAAVRLALHAPGLAALPLLTALGIAPDLTGTLDIDADLSAEGHNLHDLVRSASGRLGLALTDAEIDNRRLADLLAPLKSTKLPSDLFAGAGRTKLRCLAARIDPAQGVIAIPALVADTPRLLLTANGAFVTEDDTLALRVRPMLRAAGAGVVIPLRVAGSLAAPVVTSEGAAGPATGAALQALARPILPGLLSGERGGDSCAPVINLAHAARPK
jgi:AsmA protein